MSSEQSTIVCKTQGELARITLNRPPLNILNIAMMNEINAALEDLKSKQDTKLLVIDHQGKAFSAGVDIKDHTAEKVQEMIDVFHRMFRLLGSLDLPVVAAVDGPALGGGCELATFCDMVLASERATFGQPEIKVGVFPPIAAATLPYRVGHSRTLELLLTGELIEAEEAKQIGLINEVFPVESFRDKVDEFLAKLTCWSTPVLRLTKKAVDRGLNLSLDAAIGEVERIYLDELMRTEDAHEGLAAFMEKRKPQWKNQ